MTFGTISVRSVYQRTKVTAELENQPTKAQFSLKAFRDAEGGMLYDHAPQTLCDHRLRWHDSFTQRLYNHPELAHTNRYREFDLVYLLHELNAQKQELFQAWQEG